VHKLVNIKTKNLSLLFHSLRFVPLTDFVSAVKSHLHFRRFNIIITHKFQSISFLKATGNWCILTINSFQYSEISRYYI